MRGVALQGLAPLGLSNGAAGQQEGGGAASGGNGCKAALATVWERDREGNLVARQLQQATLAEAPAGGSVDDDLPPL